MIRRRWWALTALGPVVPQRVQDLGRPVSASSGRQHPDVCEDLSVRSNEEPSTWSDINMTEPSPARIYDYVLGGKDNYDVDRRTADAILGIWPEIRNLAFDNREFLGRVVRFLGREAGIHQFIDLGTGLPTQSNVHQVAQQTNARSRVVYVDNDPIVATHARAMLVNDDQTAFLNADIRLPSQVLAAREVREIIDFSRPLAILITAVLHFVPEDPAEIVPAYVAEIPPGSFLVLSHLTSEGATAELRAKVDQVYRNAPSPLYFRSREEIKAMFCGLPLEEPGLVDVPFWRPERSRELGPMRILGGVARVP
jgi:hypothetical protein